MAQSLNCQNPLLVMKHHNRDACDMERLDSNIAIARAVMELDMSKEFLREVDIPIEQELKALGYTGYTDIGWGRYTSINKIRRWFEVTPRFAFDYGHCEFVPIITVTTSGGKRYFFGSTAMDIDSKETKYKTVSYLDVVAVDENLQQFIQWELEDIGAVNYYSDRYKSTRYDWDDTKNALSKAECERLEERSGYDWRFSRDADDDDDDEEEEEITCPYCHKPFIH